MKKFYKTILSMTSILSLVTPIVLISGIVGRANASFSHDLIGNMGIYPISEPSILILSGIGLLGLAKIIR